MRKPSQWLRPAVEKPGDLKPRSQIRRLPLLMAAGGVCLAMLLLGTVAPASVEEQRKRLPPPAHDCDDPAAGTWMGYQYLNSYMYRFTLHVRRDVPGEPRIKGEIESHFWYTRNSETTPPSCADNRGEELIIDMPAEGTFEDNRITFIGQSWSVREVLCGVYTGSYYPDGFSGRLIPDGTEFHTENDDGYNPITTVVFRRIRCGDSAKPVPDMPDAPPVADYSVGCCGLF